MKNYYHQQFKIIKKVLGIKDIISIRFYDKKSSLFKKYNDTICTALARCFIEKKSTFIDRQVGQLCAGGNYFFNIKKNPDQEVCKIYVEEEKVFKNEKVCSLFLKNKPPYPKSAQKRYILLTPIKEEKFQSDVVLMLASPAQVGRIIGLSVFEKFYEPEIVPALSTCASIYAPLGSNKIHLNFIDYYDRYYQGKQAGKLLWSDNQMIVSMSSKVFDEIIKNIPKSAHGSFKAGVRPHKVDKIQY